MFTTMEKNWLTQSIETQRKALIRSKAKETPGGEIERLRNKEIEALTNLKTKVEGIQNVPVETVPSKQIK